MICTVKCLICGREFETNRGLGGHIIQKHNMATKEYYDIYLKKSGDGYCATCGKPISFKSINAGYAKYCLKCSHNSIECKQKRKNTNLEKYGVEHVLSSKEIRNKAKQTIKNKYGNSEIFATEHFKAKHKENSLKKYGTEHPIQNREVYVRNKSCHYKYDDLKFDSSWELAVYIWHIDHNVPIVREPCQLEYLDYNGKRHKYFPDFKVNDNIIEVKGNQYLDENNKLKDKNKQKCIDENNIIIWSYNDIKDFISYCENKFSDKYWYKIFNFKKETQCKNYKPKIKDNPVTCKICNKVFQNGNFLSAHLRFEEHIKAQDYYDSYLKKPGEGLCIVCGKPTKYINFTRGYSKTCSQLCNNSPMSDKGKNVSKSKQAYTEERKA